MEMCLSYNGENMKGNSIIQPTEWRAGRKNVEMGECPHRSQREPVDTAEDTNSKLYKTNIIKAILTKINILHLEHQNRTEN